MGAFLHGAIGKCSTVHTRRCTRRINVKSSAKRSKSIKNSFKVSLKMIKLINRETRGKRAETESTTRIFDAAGAIQPMGQGQRQSLAWGELSTSQIVWANPRRHEWDTSLFVLILLWLVVNHQFRRDNDGGGGGEPIRGGGGDGPITRRQGPHVNLQPNGTAALTELTKNPNPESGYRNNPHKISKREERWAEARIKHATTDEWMDRLDTGKPSTQNGYLDHWKELLNWQLLGYIVGRKHPKTDATQILDRAKLNSILPLAETQVN